MRGRAWATRDGRAACVGARHSLTSLHASSTGLHGLVLLVLQHIHGRATAIITTAIARPMTTPHGAGAAGKGLAMVGELLLLLLLLLVLLLAGIAKGLAGLLELGLRWQRALRGMRRRGKAAE
jgi:hypothetical protein